MELDWSPLFISLRTSAFATVLAFVTGLGAARWAVGLRGRTRAMIDGILTLPMVLPPTVVGFFLLVIFGRTSPVGQALQAMGLRVIFSWEATVIASTVVAFPMVYRTVRGAFEQIDVTVLQAARTLGLGEWTIFWRIMVPMSWPGAVAGAVLGFARALGEFGATLMLAGNIPGRTQTMPLAIFFAAEGGRMDIALLWVLLIVGISFVVVLGMNLGRGHHGH